jgi:methionyl-tRNA synthetase
VAVDQCEILDLRTATVLDVKPVKKSDKLLEFTLDDGTGEPRTILSGIAQSYPDPSVLKGKQVVFVANFAPKVMRGIASCGMILSAVNFDGSLHVATLSDPVKNGSKVC